MKGQAIQDWWPEIGTYCWGCGRNNAHGLQIKSYWQNDEAVCTWKPKDYHLAFPGVLNGGIIATLIDCHSLNTAVAAAYRAAGREMGSEPLLGYVSGSLHVNYLRPTPMDKPVVLRARVKTMSENKIVVTCSLLADGKECAAGEVVAVRVRY
jgi:acyl-coenzyme A thioesterase PaaI-like protein